MSRPPDLCHAESEHGSLLCMLPAGHAGLHYDDIDDISWMQGRTDVPGSE